MKIHSITVVVFFFLAATGWMSASETEKGGCSLCATAAVTNTRSPFFHLAKEYHGNSRAAALDPHWYCLWYTYYNPTGQILEFWEQLHSSKWAVKFSPMNYCTVWTANINFSLKKNSPVNKHDTLDIYIQEASAPYTLIYKTMFLINPSFIESYYPLYPPLGSPYSVGKPIINPKRDFLVAVQMRGLSVDSVRWKFKTPAANASRSLKFLTPTSVQTASQAIGQSVDFYLGAELCIHVPIPIELSSFMAESLSDRVRLLWETSSETNNYGFNILRAPTRDGPWEIRGFVQGEGTTAEKRQYRFDDYHDPVTIRASGELQTWYMLQQIDVDGSRTNFEPLMVSTIPDMPDGFTLDQNFPNPFGAASLGGGATTTIRYRLSRDEHVTLSVQDELGRTIKTLVEEEKNSGVHHILWNAAKIPSGTYFVRMTAGAFSSTRKVILLQ